MTLKPLPRLSGKHYKYAQGPFWITVTRRESGQLFCRYRDLLFWRLVLWVWTNDQAKKDYGAWTLELLDGELHLGEEVWHMHENNLPGWAEPIRRLYRWLRQRKLIDA